MNGDFVGTWTLKPGAPSEFNYDEAWVGSPQARVLSLSLPFRPDASPHRGDVVDFYFDNLLPESDAIRRRIRDQLALRSTGAFDLLAGIGRDCVGAVQLLPEGEHPTGWNRIDATPLDARDIEHLLGSLARPGPIPAPEKDSLRISALAGAQEKIALLGQDGRWHAPSGATPSTHILKPPIGRVGDMQADFTTSVENEWLCSKLVAAYGLPIASCEIGRFGDAKALVVERFDRRVASNGQYWIRLPQEDMCQALGVSASRKYESDGGPGMAEVLRVLAASSASFEDRRNFLKAQILFWMLAATDGHAKNFSIHHERGGSFRATPLYDVLSAWPVIGNGRDQWQWKKARLAMAVRSRNAHYHLDRIQRRHWNATAHASGVGVDAEPVIGELVAATSGAVASAHAALPAGFPDQVADAILDGVSRSAAKLATMSPD